MTPQEFKAARKHLGLTGAQLAKRLGIDPRTVRKWEQDTKDHAPNPTACIVMGWFLAGFDPEDME